MSASLSQHIRVFLNLVFRVFRWRVHKCWRVFRFKRRKGGKNLVDSISHHKSKMSMESFLYKSAPACGGSGGKADVGGLLHLNVRYLFTVYHFFSLLTIYCLLIYFDRNFKREREKRRKSIINSKPSQHGFTILFGYSRKSRAK